jgi:uncharacterized protein (DUF302 family)
MLSEKDRGLVHLDSPYTVADTIARLEEIIRSKGITVLALIDHGGDAARAGLRMNPTQLLIFGNAKAGTPMMIASPSVAIDLPLKALAREDANGKVWLSYNSPEYLETRHSIPHDLIQNVAGIKAFSNILSRLRPIVHAIKRRSQRGRPVAPAPEGQNEFQEIRQRRSLRRIRRQQEWSILCGYGLGQDPPNRPCPV